MRDLPMQTVLIDVAEELNRIVSISQLIPSTHLSVLEDLMVQLREDDNQKTQEGAAIALDMILATVELKSAAHAYAEFIIGLADQVRDQSSG